MIRACAVGNAVRSDTFRIFQLDADTCFDSWTDDDRIDIEKFDDPVAKLCMILGTTLETITL